MEHFFGLILRDNDIEVIGDESPGQGFYQGLQAAIFEGKKMLKQNPNIRQINIYRGIQEIPGVQGRRMLDYQIFQEN